MTDPELQADTRRLLIEAEIASEQLVSLLRMGVAAGLLLFFALTVGPLSDFGDAMQQRQWLFAAATMGAYFAVGLGAWLLGRAGAITSVKDIVCFEERSGFILSSAEWARRACAPPLWCGVCLGRARDLSGTPHPALMGIYEVT